MVQIKYVLNVLLSLFSGSAHLPGVSALEVPWGAVWRTGKSALGWASRLCAVTLSEGLSYRQLCLSGSQLSRAWCRRPFESGLWTDQTLPIPTLWAGAGDGLGSWRYTRAAPRQHCFPFQDVSRLPGSLMYSM